MTLLTEQEINECFESVMFSIEVEASRELIARAIESAVVKKLKAQGVTTIHLHNDWAPND